MVVSGQLCLIKSYVKNGNKRNNHLIKSCSRQMSKKKMLQIAETIIQIIHKRYTTYITLNMRWRTRHARMDRRTISRSYSRQAVDILCETIIILFQGSTILRPQWQTKVCVVLDGQPSRRGWSSVRTGRGLDSEEQERRVSENSLTATER